jgi:uncharacterized repeat protein (TIGR03803 family)
MRQRTTFAVTTLIMAWLVLLIGGATAVAQTPTMTTLAPWPDGSSEASQLVQGGLIQASDLNFYGVAGEASSTFGVIFRMTPEGNVTILHSFTGDDGRYPLTTLIQAAGGHLYGTTVFGGSADKGTVFRMTLDGTFSIVHHFADGVEGAAPEGLVEGPDGNLYGTTGLGGSANLGTIFRMTPDGAVEALHNFEGGSEIHGANGLTYDPVTGHFYGTSSGGGSAGFGTIYRMTSEGDVTILHSFSGGLSGRQPRGLTQAVDGNFYGVTELGGAFDNGTLFRMTPTGQVTTLHSFPHSDQGSVFGHPRGRLLASSDLHLYGAVDGQRPPPFPCEPFPCSDIGGYVFKVDFAGHVTRVSPTFSGSEGFLIPLAQGRDGHLYGATRQRLFRISNFAPCTDKITASYHAGTLNLGFTISNLAPATWKVWLAVPGPPEQSGLLWSLPLATRPTPAFGNLAVPNFPAIGPLFVLSAVTIPNGPICADWNLIQAGETESASSPR